MLSLNIETLGNFMSNAFIDRLKRGPVLCDGAMGTLLYSKGVFINRCYDELNLSNPEMIRAIHHDYIRAGNIGKVLVMLLAPFLGKPIPLLPLQLLWLNLLTDGLLGLGMSVEPPESDTMRRPPYSPKEGVFAGRAGAQVIWVGALIGALALGIGAWYYFSGREQWQTMVFTFLAFAQVLQALASRSTKDSLFKQGIMSNRVLAGLAVLVVALQLGVIYVPALAGFFDLKPLSLYDLAIAAAGGITVFAAIELSKRRGG